MNKIIIQKMLEAFLKESKKRVKNNGLVLIPRKKNMDSIYKMGLTIPIIEEIICNLTIDDYYSGPEEDHLSPEDTIWVFLVEDIEKIYIKLKLVDDDKTVCISFHEAEF